MTKDHSAKVPVLKPAALNARDYAAIGRLIRGAADVEDCVTLYICKMLALTEGKAVLLLGVMPIRNKVELAETIAKTRSKRAVDLWKTWLGNPTFRAVIDARNAVAHGIIVGQADNGDIAFRTVTKAGFGKREMGLEILLYGADQIENLADLAEQGAIAMRADLGLQPLLDKRQSPRLVPHPKSNQPKNRSQAPRPPRRKPPPQS